MFPGGMGGPGGSPGKPPVQMPLPGMEDAMGGGETELSGCGARNCTNNDGMGGCSLGSIEINDRGSCLSYEPTGGPSKGPDGGRGAGIPGPGRVGPPPPPALGA